MSVANTSLNAGVTGYAATAFGAGQQISRFLEEKVENISFVLNGATVVAFDAVVQETHGIEMQPTAFPIEDGGTISDHVIRTPREINLQGIVTDTPLRDKKLLAQELISTAAGAVGGPLGIYALSQAQAFASSQASAETISPSIAAFRKIIQMAAGSDQAPPTPFTVRTAITDYPNMVIRSVSVPRDVTTGAGLVFGMTLTSMVVVTSQTVAATITAVGKQGLNRIKAAREQTEDTRPSAYQEGVNGADLSYGAQARYQGVPSSLTGVD